MNQTMPQIGETQNPLQLEGSLTREMLDLIAFSEMPSKNETEGVGRNGGIRYRTAEFLAFDNEGKQRSYRVKVSTAGTRTIYDLGRTSAQRETDTLNAYNALQPKTRAAVESLGLGDIWIGSKTILGEAMEGVKNESSLRAVVGGKNAAVIQALFPGVSTAKEMFASLRKYLADFKE